MSRYETAKEVINNAAGECGLTPLADVFASLDPAFIQLRNLLTSVGRELVGLHTWQRLIKTHTITTAVPPDDNEYALPDNFAYMIPQTGWSPSEMMPLGGPLSPQDWTYLVNSGLGPSTIYVSFRVAQGAFMLLPDPPPDAVTINFEYISRDWVLEGATEKDKAENNADVVLFETILISKFLKLRFLEAKGFDTTAALGQFQSVFMQWTGNDISAPILSMARNRVFPYLGWRNIPETNYGL